MMLITLGIVQHQNPCSSTGPVIVSEQSAWPRYLLHTVQPGWSCLVVATVDTSPQR